MKAGNKSSEWDGFLLPKAGSRKKRKKHGKSILQPKEAKYCYLCAVLYGDCRTKAVQEHHIVFGSANRAVSEELGLKVNLCGGHHEHGEEAVHNNSEMARLLQREAQKKFEETHTREEWMRRIGRNYLGTT